MRALRPLLLLAAAIALVTGVLAGPTRAGLLPPLSRDVVVFHGPLMVSGFTGTLIALERAVALGRGWAYLGPVSMAGGSLALLAGAPAAGRFAYAVGGACLAAVCVWIWHKQRELFNVVIAVGAGCLLVGNLMWALGAAVPRVALWWAGFPVMTIAGERLELARVLAPRPSELVRFRVLVALWVAALVLALEWPDAGTRMAGAAAIGLAWWLARNDVARRTVRSGGLPRYSAIALLAAYVWLIAGGLVMLAAGYQVAGPTYDAQLHALFLGFMFSMIFGHAPIIFPAVLGLPVRFRPVFYVHLTALHAGVALRLGGDLAGWNGGARGGMILTAVAIALFLLLTGASVLPAVVQRRRSGARPAAAP